MKRGLRKSNDDDPHPLNNLSKMSPLCTSASWVYRPSAASEIDDAGERRDATQCMLQGRLAAALNRLNPNLPHDTREEVVRVVSRPPHPTLIQNNRWLHDLIVNGVEIEYPDAASGEMRGGRARIVDFDEP